MKHALAANLVMIAELTVKEDRLDEFFDYTVENLPISRSYAGNIEFDILIDEVTPSRVIFYELWESAEAQRAYMAWRLEAGDLTKLMSLLVAEPKFTALRAIAAEPYPGG
jgi:quinol monooxygenase YgiN